MSRFIWKAKTVYSFILSCRSHYRVISLFVNPSIQPPAYLSYLIISLSIRLCIFPFCILCPSCYPSFFFFFLNCQFFQFLSVLSIHLLIHLAHLFINQYLSIHSLVHSICISIHLSIQISLIISPFIHLPIFLKSITPVHFIFCAFIHFSSSCPSIHLYNLWWLQI